jgi:predicted kinase
VQRLIHLNGPPGIGKSTLAQLYVDDHPGVLNLDIDLVRTLIGGWRDRFAETGQIVRPVALAMAAAHLRGGRDVIMPQYLGRLGEIERFGVVARDNGAAFCEIAVMDDRHQALARFYRGRDDDDKAGWHLAVRQIVEQGGGTALLADIYDQLTSVLAARPQVTILASTEGAITEDYQALTTILQTT